MRLSLARRAWQGWQDAAGSWQGWSACPALVAPETADITPRVAARPAAERLATELATTLQHGAGAATGGTALVLDLEPVLVGSVDETKTLAIVESRDQSWYVVGDLLQLLLAVFEFQFGQLA